MTGVSIEGTWRIVEMELWDREAVDLAGPAVIHIGPDRQGSFRFIAVQGWMDIQAAEREGRPAIEFTWDGTDECEPANGRGSATLLGDGALHGRIYFHRGDDSGFRAVRDDAD